MLFSKMKMNQREEAKFLLLRTVINEYEWPEIFQVVFAFCDTLNLLLIECMRRKKEAEKTFYLKLFFNHATNIFLSSKWNN